MPAGCISPYNMVFQLQFFRYCMGCQNFKICRIRKIWRNCFLNYKYMVYGGLPLYLYLIHQKISYVIEFYTMEIVNKYWVQFVAYIVAFIVSLMLALLIRKTVTSIQRVVTITKK